MLTCSRRSVVVGQNSTRIHVLGTVWGWSDVVYVRGNHNIPKNTTVEISLESKETSKKSKRRYLRGSDVRIIVDRCFVLSALEESVFWKARSVMSVFEEKTKGGEGSSSYAASWVDYILRGDFDSAVSKALSNLKERILAADRGMYVSIFESTLLSCGLSGPQARTLAGYIDWSEGAVLTGPVALAMEWVKRPYSPYLGELDLRTRDTLASNGRGDAGERVRFIVHAQVLAREMDGYTYLPRADAVVELGSHDGAKEYGDDFYNNLQHDDLYRKPQSNGLKNWRDPTLSVYGGYVQHSDVAAAECGILAYWEDNGCRVPHLRESGVAYDTSGLNPMQVSAFREVCEHHISCVTGGPGRGKTWLSRRVCDFWQRSAGGGVLVVCSYHQPLKNLQRGIALEKDLKPPCGFRTIASCVNDHKGLFCTCSSPTCGCSNLDSLLIIEEAGVSTILDMYGILHKASRDRTRVTVVLSGDDGQLRPIGAGQPFGEFSRFHPEKTTRLVENMRTDSPNLCFNIESVKSGRSDLRVGPDFVWVKDISPLSPKCGEVARGRFFSSYLSEFDLEENVVIVQKNETRRVLNEMIHNKHLESLVSEGRLCKSRASYIEKSSASSACRFVRGTRVVCRETSECGSITNGTRGVVVGGQRNHSLVSVKCDDGHICSTKRAVWDLAYSITAHKAQGNEYDCVYIYSFDDYHMSREWLYTAISRAKKKVVYMVPFKQHSRGVGAWESRPDTSLLALRANDARNGGWGVKKARYK